MQLTNNTKLLTAGGSFIAVAATLFVLGAPLWGVFAASLCVAAIVFLVFPVKSGVADEAPVVDSQTADMKKASQAIDAAIERLTVAMEKPMISPNDKKNISNISKHLKSIGDQVSQDPKDYKLARKFIFNYMESIVKTVEDYTDLVLRARGTKAGRMKELAGQIADFATNVQELDEKCTENDFSALESEISATKFQVERG